MQLAFLYNKRLLAGAKKCKPTAITLAAAMMDRGSNETVHPTVVPIAAA